MSILLSIYFPEGIVFAADKNATISGVTAAGQPVRYVEPTATKVLSWPRHRAIVGYVGLGQLAGYELDEWMRVFIAGSRDFQDIHALAQQLRDCIQADFDRDYPPGTNVSRRVLVIHLGGFADCDGARVPVIYHIRNHESIDEKTGAYSPGQRVFAVDECIERDSKGWPNPEDYPTRVQTRLQKIVDERHFYWFANGYNLGAFNVFKGVIWKALHNIRDAGFAEGLSGLDARIAFCKMSVEVFGSYFTHHHRPDERAVGGGVDVVYIPWPDGA